MVGGPATPQVRAILREGDAAVASANLVESLDVVARDCTSFNEPIRFGSMTSSSDN
jgi:hypothetical protein